MSAAPADAENSQATQQDKLPRAFTRRLAAGERVVFSGRGHGYDLAFEHFAIPGIFVAAYIAWASVNGHVPGAPDTIVAILFALFSFGIIVAVGFSLIAGSNGAWFAVTDRRMLYRRSGPLEMAFALTGPSDRYGWRIRTLRVTGTKDRGSIKLHPMLALPSNGPVLLAGVEKPLEVAQLIKNTLNLDLPIEDRTK